MTTTTTTTTPTTAAIPLGRWAADPMHCHAGFAVKRMVVATFRGEFTDVNATLVSTADGIRLDGSLSVDSVSVASPDLRGHLLSPDFFDVERAPRIGFASTEVRVGDDGGVVVDGELTIKGITRPIRARGVLGGPVVDPHGRERVGLDLEATIDRTAYDLTWNMPLPNGGLAVGNDVRLTVSLELTREDA
jgi:polyisoprenoid-binding protein YceI